MPPKKSSKTVPKSSSPCHTCSICSEVIHDSSATCAGQDALFCEGSCNSWIHRHCAGIPHSHFARLSSSNDPFYCFSCSLATLNSTVSHQKDVIFTLKESVQALSQDLLALQSTTRSVSMIAKELPGCVDEASKPIEDKHLTPPPPLLPHPSPSSALPVPSHSSSSTSKTSSQACPNPSLPHKPILPMAPVSAATPHHPAVSPEISSSPLLPFPTPPPPPLLSLPLPPPSLTTSPFLSNRQTVPWKPPLLPTPHPSTLLHPFFPLHPPPQAQPPITAQPPISPQFSTHPRSHPSNRYQNPLPLHPQPQRQLPPYPQHQPPLPVPPHLNNFSLPPTTPRSLIHPALLNLLQLLVPPLLPCIPPHF